MPQYYPLFILASALLILTPGPNVALIVANAVTYGARYGLLTVAGTMMAATVHVLFVGFGLGSVLGHLGTVFEWVRWLGVLYLLYIGLQTWRAHPVDLTQIRPDPRLAPAILRRAILVSLTNPKTLLFYGAFFPQFIAPDRDVTPQIWVLCITFLVIAATIDSLWALAAARARRLLSKHARLRNRISGGLLMGAGLGLALARPR